MFCRIDAYFIKYKINESKQNDEWNKTKDIMDIANRLCRDMGKNQKNIKTAESNSIENTRH
jgi:hypothetical protein